MASHKQINQHSAKLALGAFETAFAAPMVAGIRVWQMALAGSKPSARDRREQRRMVAEKQAAAGEVWLAMSQQLVTANQQLAMAMWQLWWKPALSANGMANFTRAMQLASIDMMHSGLKPVRRKVRANLKRLGH